MMFVSVCLLQPVVCGSFLPQGLIPRPKSWESCHPSNELQQKAKVGHSLGLLTLPTDALSAASFEIDGTLANEKGRVGKPCFSSSKEASGASSAGSIFHSSFTTRDPETFSVTNLCCGWLMMHNDLCWCFSVAASGVWEFPPQGLNSRLKSWGSCTHPQSYSKRLKVGHNSGLLLLTHAN